MSNTLTLERPLRHGYPLSREPQIRRINPNVNSGVENLKLERLIAGDNTGRDNQYTIHFSYAAQGGVRGGSQLQGLRQPYRRGQQHED